MWHPGATENKRRALPAYCPDLLTRFCKEGALAKFEMLPDVDHMDVGARQENLAVRGEPILLQLCVVPAYALTTVGGQTTYNFETSICPPLMRSVR